MSVSGPLTAEAAHAVLAELDESTRRMREFVRRVPIRPATGFGSGSPSVWRPSTAEPGLSTGCSARSPHRSTAQTIRGSSGLKVRDVLASQLR